MERRHFIGKSILLGVSGYLILGYQTPAIAEMKKLNFLQSKNYKTMNPDFLKILKETIQAPSGHNTQPWKFRITENSIHLIPDHSRSLPYADPDNREFYISQGTALENLVLSANNSGYLTDITNHLSEDPEYIEIKLKKGSVDKDPISEFICKRQTNRNKYFNKPIPQKDMLFLTESQKKSDTELFVIKDDNSFKTILDLIEEANIIQLNDKNYKEELISWIRFNKSESHKYNDGISFKVIGTPSIPRFLGELILKGAIKPSSQSKTDNLNINSSPALVLFSTPGRSKEDWINAGREFQRFSLKAASVGITVAHHNQPIQVKETAIKLKDRLNIKNNPALLVRVGYSDRAPDANRRNVEEMIV